MSLRSQRGSVASLHVHGARGGDPMQTLPEIELVVGQGIIQDRRYFGRKSRHGEPGKRQVTLIEREQISEHCAVLGLSSIPPGIVRSNIETEGIDLSGLQGRYVRVGTAVILVGKPRDPCAKMDQIAPGLKNLMDHGKQGVLATVVVSGTVHVSDEISVCSKPPD
jgi:MOSC domain-containing protein YiiM